MPIRDVLPQGASSGRVKQIVPVATAAAKLWEAGRTTLTEVNFKHLLRLQEQPSRETQPALLKGPGEENDAQCAHLIALEPPLRAARTHPAEIAPDRRAWLTCGTKGLAGGSLCLACLCSCAHRAEEGDGAI